MLSIYRKESTQGAPSSKFARVNALYDKWIVQVDQHMSPLSTKMSGSEAGSVVSERNSPELDDRDDRETSAISPNSTNPSTDSEGPSPSSPAHGGSSDVNDRNPITPPKRVTCVGLVSDSESSPISPEKKFRTPYGMRHRGNQQNKSQCPEKENYPAPDSDDDVPLLSESQKVKEPCKIISHPSTPDSDDEILRPSTLRKRWRSKEAVETTAEKEDDTIVVEIPSKRRRTRR
ncbi:hypothetical protein IFR04_002465 [Cadophora malorum]|uniref:Uncharacterized protein n=1 Tax=Cadophora malorum TaxID=108018 RepID=A0A8H7WGD6_9HELO|nr:hypothetical protein IFR04_002465 [Cadophora malorum]